MSEKIKAKWEKAKFEFVKFTSRDIATQSDPYEGEIDRTSLSYSRGSSQSVEWD